MHGRARAAAARTPRASRRAMTRTPPSRCNLQAVPGDLDAAAGELGALRGILIEDRVGVVHVNEEAAGRVRQPPEPLEHSARTALRQVAEVTGAFVRYAESRHLVIA